MSRDLDQAHTVSSENSSLMGHSVPYSVSLPLEAAGEKLYISLPGLAGEGNIPKSLKMLSDDVILFFATPLIEGISSQIWVKHIERDIILSQLM